MRDRSLAALLAEDESSSEHGPEMAADDSLPTDDYEEELDDGHMIAAEEMLSAMESRDPRALLTALRSFIRMVS